MKVEDMEIHPLNDGCIRLDGGAMFGIVPRVIWQKTNPPDDRNRIKLALRPLLIATGEEQILVDTGIGRKHDDRFREMFGVDQSGSGLLEGLAAAGRSPEDITTVILTHLHFDHAGGATRLDGSRNPVPVFPRARHIVQRVEWHDAVNPNRRTRGSYRPDDFLPLESAGLLELVDGDIEIAPGIKLKRTGGHTRGHQVVTIRSRENTCIYWADLIPTASHVAIPYIMGYDLFPLDTMRCKEELLAQAADEKWTGIFEHEPGIEFARIVREDKRFRALDIGTRENRTETAP